MKYNVSIPRVDFFKKKKMEHLLIRGRSSIQGCSPHSKIVSSKVLVRLTHLADEEVLHSISLQSFANLRVRQNIQSSALFAIETIALQSDSITKEGYFF